MKVFECIFNGIQHGRSYWLATMLDGHRGIPAGFQILLNENGSFLNEGDLSRLRYLGFETEEWHREIVRILASNQVGVATISFVRGTSGVDSGMSSTRWLLEYYSPPPRLVVVGSGHVAVALVELATHLDYEVIVIDDRKEYMTESVFRNVDHLICGDLAKSLSDMNLNSQTYVVLVTRSHRHDVECLKALHGIHLAYLGIIGSQRRIRSVFKLLSQDGIYNYDYPNMYAPVGLDIGAEHPTEIALSILAELQLVRFGGTGRPLMHTKTREHIHAREHPRTRIDWKLLRALAQAERDAIPFVTVTVVSAQGHVPRGIGSKMVVYSDGTTVGTIGGGKREYEICLRASEQLKTSEALLQCVHFHGNYDSFEPVCGGTIEVFLQPYKPTPEAVEA